MFERPKNPKMMEEKKIEQKAKKNYILFNWAQYTREKKYAWQVCLQRNVTRAQWKQKNSVVKNNNVMFIVYYKNIRFLFSVGRLLTSNSLSLISQSYQNIKLFFRYFHTSYAHIDIYFKSKTNPNYFQLLHIINVGSLLYTDWQRPQNDLIGW